MDSLNSEQPIEASGPDLGNRTATEHLTNVQLNEVGHADGPGSHEEQMQPIQSSGHSDAASSVPSAVKLISLWSVQQAISGKGATLEPLQECWRLAQNSSTEVRYTPVFDRSQQLRWFNAVKKARDGNTLLGKPLADCMRKERQRNPAAAKVREARLKATKFHFVNE